MTKLSFLNYLTCKIAEKTQQWKDYNLLNIPLLRGSTVYKTKDEKEMRVRVQIFLG